MEGRVQPEVKMAQPYIYRSFSETSRIRVLALLPNTFESDVQITLREEDLLSESITPYTALSYTWGSREDPTRIYVNQPDHGSETYGALDVTRNLYEALKHLRHEHESRDFRIDAICIDQGDLLERASQVKLMTDIYVKAQDTVVWLGPASDKSSFAMNKLRQWDQSLHTGDPATTKYFNIDGKTIEFDSRRVLIRLDTPDSRAINALIHRDWFNRLWIRQEIYHSEEKASLMCGKDLMPWMRFKQTIIAVFRNPKHSFKRGSGHNDTGDRLLFRAMLIKYLTNFQDKSLINTLRTASSSECQDSRDRIFAVLGVLSPKHDWFKSATVVDYTLSVNTVYTNAAAMIIQHDQDLDILRYCDFKDDGQPTWVPQVEVKI